MMRTLAMGLADLQARARDGATPDNAEPLAAMILAFGRGALAPFVATTAVGVSLDRVLTAGRALDAAREDGSSSKAAHLSEFEAALYRLAMAAETAKPDEGAMSALPDYDQTEAPNPVTRTS